MTVEIRDGIVIVDGAPKVLVTADYPYYRDRREFWEDRLRAIREHLGIEVVSCYVPWRHHQPRPDSPPDFTGHSHPGRDLLGFLDRCRRVGIAVILKPGPFIHAETDYGGLPDWVCPDRDPAIEPVLDSAGQPATWSGPAGPDGAPGQWPLPAPLGQAFLGHTAQWLRTVGKEVLEPASHPHGPVLLVQIANEGIYTNGSRPLWSYDYSMSALAFFRTRLRGWYGDLETYNRRHGTAYRDWESVEPPRSWSAAERAEDQLTFVDWGRFHADYLAEVYRTWAGWLETGLPVVANLNPPAGERDSFDAWLARVRPGTWENIHYGFTNWMGVVSADPDAHARYLLAAKRARGPNLEENWGFAELYDPAYAAGATSFHQTLLALAAGATGFNVFTGVATAHWQPELDSVHRVPYPDRAPITQDGEPTAKAGAVRRLAGFFGRHGTEYLACRPVTAGAFALYPPYASIAAWAPDGAAAPECGRALRAYLDRMRAAGRDFELIDLATATHPRLLAHPRITFAGGPFLDRRVQQLLAEYLRGGGRLDLSGPVPTLDEQLAPCSILATALAEAPAGEPDADPATGVRRLAGVADLYLRVHPERDVAYLAVLVGDRGEAPVQAELHCHGRTHAVRVVAAAGGAAILRIAAGRLDDFLITGVNQHTGAALAPECAMDGAVVSAGEPADLARLDGVLIQTHPS
jgi:beta-galactosidase